MIYPPPASKASAPSLGSITDTVGHPSDGAGNDGIYRANLRQNRLQTAKELLPNESRLQACLCCRVDVAAPISIDYAQDEEGEGEGEGRATWSNLVTCGNPWICPNCGRIAAHRKAVELRADVALWEHLGRSVVFATFTLQHFREEALAIVWGRLIEAFKKLWDGRAGRRFKAKWAIVGRRRSPDATWTERNGWHPHFHVFLFLERGELSDAEQEEFQRELAGLWKDACDLAGGYCDWDHGLLCRFQGAVDAADYITSKACGNGPEWSHVEEMTKHGEKRAGAGGYNPNQLLERAMWGEEWAGRLWFEYAEHFKGKKFLDTSNGFRAALNGLKEQFKEEMAELLDDGPMLNYRPLVYLSPKALGQVVKIDGQLWLLEVVKRSGGDAAPVKDWLDKEGIGEYWFPDLDLRPPDWCYHLPEDVEPPPPEVIEARRAIGEMFKAWNSELSSSETAHNDPHAPPPSLSMDDNNPQTAKQAKMEGF